MPQIKACLKKTQYLLKCGAYILCLFLIIIEINNDTIINYTAKNIYYHNTYTHQNKPQNVQKIPKSYYPIIEMSDDLWKYLREGLNYLETDSKNYPPAFAHPGGKAFGSLGLTRIAIEDVIARCKELTQLKPQQVLSDNEIYENFAKAYADILLRHYLKVNYCAMPVEEVFDILQKAWFLGPGLYKNGENIISSRQQRADEYKTRVKTNLVL